MYANSILAVSGLVSLVAAVPMVGQQHKHHHHQRDIVWETATEEVVVTVPVTKTVWMEPGETPSAHEGNHGAHHYGSPAETTTTADVEPASYSPEAPASTPEVSISTPESSYVAPVASTTPAYVAPSPTSTPVYVAPTTTSTSIYVAPTPTSEWVAPTTYIAPPSSSTAAPAETSTAPSSGTGLTYGAGKSGTTYTGDLTYYECGLGACGYTNTDNDTIVAVAESLFDSYGTANPNNNPLCNQTISITGVDGMVYQATVVDRCTGCAESDLDLSPDFFNKVTDNGNGRVHDITWSFN